MKNKNSNFCHLHLHTDKGSLLDGLGKASEYAERAKELGFKYMGITDHGSIDCCIDFQNECLKRDIIPIIGCELYLVSSGDFKGKSGHCCVFVENETGWRNLCEILSIANLEHFYRKPRVDFDILYEKCEGLVITTACAGSWLKLEGAEKFLKKLHKKVGNNNIFLEIMPHNLEVQHEVNDMCLRLHEETGIQLITTTDAHYVKDEDHKIHDVLLAIQTKTTMDNPNRFRFNFDGAHMQTWEEILENYEKIGKIDKLTVKKSLFNTNKIAEKCKDFRIKKREISLPDCNPFPEMDSKKALKKLYAQKAKDRLDIDLNDPKHKEYKDRIEMEYKVICDKNFQMYFLIVCDFIDWCKNQGFIVGPARGSVAGSYLSYVLGITEIDPMEHDLIFERFLNPERDSYPDIDIDIPDNKRAEARQYLIEKYGENHIAGISTFSYLKGKSVIRDVSRVFNVPLDEVDVFAKSLEDKGTEIVKNGKETEEGKSFYKKYPEIVDIAIKLEGTVRGKGQHAAGVVVSSQDLTVSGQCNLMSMGKKGEKQNVVNWNLDNAEYLGLMKLDLLGLSQLSIIGESFYLIQKNENKKLNIRDFLDVSDQNIFSSLSRGHTAGVFQMNTRTMTSYIKKLGINNFEDISACLALVRPGAADSGVADEYLLRNSGKQWDKKHTIYEDITKETLGLICYQEQSMFMFTRMAGLPFSVADSIRKIIGKKRDVREFDRYKDMFIEGCLKEKTMTKDEALQFWTELEASANYSFNKSHSVSYAYLSYITAWLKYYYQAYFYSANLTCGSSDKKAQIVKEAYDHGLDLKLPKVGFSDAHKWAVNDGTLIAPFSEIKGLGHSHAIEAAQEKKKQFKQASFYVTKERQENETKIRKLLTMVDAWDYNGKPSEYMQEYFDFPISNDVSVIAPTLLKMCKKYYTQEEIYKIYKGKKYPSKLNLIKKYKKPEETNFTCKGCSIQMRPYPTNFGDKTLMIITEHPSYWDNDKGKLLSCDTSNELLMKLFEMNIYYEDITVATGVKCYPGKGNKPADEHRRTCWVHLMDEIEKAKPKIILSLGKACEFFDSEYKISEKAGTFEWSEKHKTFIFYAYSFGYASIDQDKRDKYNMSIKKFVKTIEKVVNN